jgi:transcriptional regulator with XRE-family HTH domain
MINSEDFSKRLEKVIHFYDETAASFAENIGVQRSSISHILSGRNKPSLDFVLKILSAYPEVELYWLLNGKGKFPKAESETHANISNSPPEEKFQTNNTNKKEIDRIVIFYTDGTFKNFNET